MSKKQRIKAALEECPSYNRLGGLDDAVMADIAFDHDLTLDELKAAWLS